MLIKLVLQVAKRHLLVKGGYAAARVESEDLEVKLVPPLDTFHAPIRQAPPIMHGITQFSELVYFGDLKVRVLKVPQLG
jgi:hypothetical protein